MTPDRIRDAAQILGELGNGKMANELLELADQIEALKRKTTPHHESCCCLRCSERRMGR